MEINLSESDTTYKVVCSFQNQKYQHLTDIGLVSMYSKYGGKRLREYN